MRTEHFNIRDSYTIYKKISKHPINEDSYCKLQKEFMKFISNFLLKNGEVILPDKLGKLQIIGKKPKIKVEDNRIKGLTPDWFETKKLWEQNKEAKEQKKLVYHFNEDTNGVRYRLLWSRNRVLLTNKTLYTFRLTRKNKRTLAKEIKNGKEYMILTNIK